MYNITKNIVLNDNIFKENNFHKIEFLGSIEKYKKGKSKEDKKEYILDDYREKYLFFKMKNDIYVLCEKCDYLQKAFLNKPVEYLVDIELESKLLTKNLFYDIISPGCNKIDDLISDYSTFSFVPSKETPVRLKDTKDEKIFLEPIIINTNDKFIASYSTSIMQPFEVIFADLDFLIEKINIYPFIGEYLDKSKNNLEKF